LKQTPPEFLSARLAASREVIAGLKIASQKIFGFDRQEVLALIARISECADPQNHFIAKDAHSKDTGECYDAVGNLWSCGSKLCPTCLSVQSRRNRKKLRDALNRQEMRRGERYYFATFTITNPGLSLKQTRDLVNRAWTLFRKRRLCVDLIRGGSKSEEFTLTRNGYHYHLHCIFLSRFLLFNEVRRVWTECVEKAFDEQNIPFVVQTKDGNLFVKLITITNLEKTIFEVCKYVTKSDSWSKMKAEHLAEIALVRRWNRMFEMFGSFAMRKERDTIIDDDSPESSIVHTTNLSDGDEPSHDEYWRDAVQEIGLDAYLERLADEIARTRELRLKQICMRWPAATIEIFDAGRPEI
jgi:hypothetical protein